MSIFEISASHSSTLLKALLDKRFSYPARRRSSTDIINDTLKKLIQKEVVSGLADIFNSMPRKGDNGDSMTDDNAFSSFMGQESGGRNFDQRKMRYGFYYNLQWQQIEMYAVSTSDQKIDLPLLESEFLWKEGEKILVEISRKFEPHQLQKQFEYFGLESIAHFKDPQKWFSLLLFRCCSDRSQSRQS